MEVYWKFVTAKKQLGKCANGNFFAENDQILRLVRARGVSLHYTYK